MRLMAWRLVSMLLVSRLLVATNASAAMAQGLEGPLAETVGASASQTAHKPVKHATPRRSKPVVRRPETPLAGRLPPTAAVPTAAVPTSEFAPAKSVAPTDPVSFGMKWNGSNDSVGQTRIENLNGNAAGTGAELGMKLHF